MSQKKRINPLIRQASRVERWEAKREPIFALLDYYIAIGWGHVPRTAIEALIAEHGELPSKPPPEYCSHEQYVRSAA